MSIATLQAISLRTTWREMRRYPFELFTAFVSGYVVFLVLFYGAKAAVAASHGHTPDSTYGSLIVVYAITLETVAIAGSVVATLANNQESGTTEQYAMSPFGLTNVILCNGVSQVIATQLVVFPVLFAAMLTTGHFVHVPLLSFLVVSALTITGSLGLACTLAGLQLVFKRISHLLQIMQLLFVALAAAPIRPPVLRLVLPIVQPARMLRYVMVSNRDLGALRTSDLLVLAGNSALWLTLGILVLGRMLRSAKTRGTLGHY